MENAVIERVKNQVKNLKTLSDELKVQMALGKAEAKDYIEDERKNISEYFRKHKSEMAKVESTTTANRRDFLTYVEDLESSLHEAVPTKVRAYEAYKKNVLEKVYRLEEAIREHYPTQSSTLQDKLEIFKAKMDAFRVNLALHDKDDPEKVRQVKREFSEKVAEIRTTLAKKEEAQTKLENFFEDLSESFNYLKKAISDLSN
ncbi:MAG: hypothetical protein HKN67_05870 [Saprospiraceae bacterium]|nr:hypothetical protein [Saprospiraceae bacterium]